MQNNKRICELLVETGAYTDLKDPVILTSGELGIYYINTEKLVQDNGEFNNYGDRSDLMINHAIKMIVEHPTFNEVIDILSEKTEELLSGKDKEERIISGGQRRDWLFSGPVARNLKLPHLSLYKNGKMEFLDKYGCIISGDIKDLPMGGFYDVHIVDLITEGSSVYTKKEDKETGWVPMIREKGEIKDLVAVVTRLQGGEEMLAKQNVAVHSFVAIDEDFINKYSKEPERAIVYMRGPKEWSENYLKKEGALALIKTFDPDGKKLDRAKKFINRYAGILKDNDRFIELDNAAKGRYNKYLSEIIGN